MVLFKTLSGTIPANSNEITFTDSIINSNTIVEAYYNNNDVYTVETWQDGTTIGIVVNDHTVPVSIKVTLNNVNSFEPYDDTNLVNQINSLSDDVSALDGRLDDAEDDIDNLENDVDSLESSKQDVLTAGTGISIVNNVISAITSSNYSLSEQVIGTWYNGKPLYSRVIIIDMNSSVINYHENAFDDIDDFIITSGYYDNNGVTLGLNSFETTTYYTRTGFRFEQHDIYLRTGNYSPSKAIIMAIYTKSTD